MSTLTNIGLDLGFTHAPIRRLIFCLTTNDSAAANVISLADAATLANWQTQFNQYTHLDDHSDRFVCTPLVREVVKEAVDATYWEVEDYKTKMRNGYADISFSLLDPSPYILANLKPYEDQTISVFLITEDSEAIGIKDGTDLKPIPIKVGSFSVPDWSPRGYEEGSRNVITFRLNVATDLNSVVAVTIASSDIYDDTDFYSLRDVTATIASPAVTGCTFTPVVDDVDPSAPSTAIPVTGIVFGEVIFMLNESPWTEVSLAAEGSISYLAGVYTVNEGALLTADKDYELKISHAAYDCIPSGLVEVPA